MLNILVIGNGQCGNRILDSVNKHAFGGGKSGKLVKFYSKQKFKSNVQTIAFNTAVNDLKEMKFTKAKDRVHIPHLHGVGANRNIGKKVFEEKKEMIMRQIEEKGSFDIAFLPAFPSRRASLYINFCSRDKVSTNSANNCCSRSVCSPTLCSTSS